MPSLTITTTAEHQARIQAALGERYGRDATAAEVKAELIEYLKGRVHSYESAQAAATAADAVTKIDPS
jgi:hypothetical protein